MSARRRFVTVENCTVLTRSVASYVDAIVVTILRKLVALMLMSVKIHLFVRKTLNARTLKEVSGWSYSKFSDTVQTLLYRLCSIPFSAACAKLDTVAIYV